MKIDKPYYTLAIKEDGKWMPEFGAYSRETVKDECYEYWQCGRYHPRHLKIIKSGESQQDIEAAIAKLNQAETN